MNPTEHVFPAHVGPEGKLEMPGKERLKEVLKTMTGKEIQLSVRLEPRGRNIDQNAYYWGIVLEYIRDGLEDLWGVGYTTHDIHELMKDKFLKVVTINPVTGEVREGTQSTTEMTVENFGLYIEKCICWSSMVLSVVIPPPLTSHIRWNKELWNWS